MVRAQGTGPIRIGFPTPLTGPFGTEAKDQVKRAELAVTEFNDAGGLNGRKASCWCATTSSIPARRPPARWS